jgi:hypothetical protein
MIGQIEVLCNNGLKSAHHNLVYHDHFMTVLTTRGYLTFFSLPLLDEDKQLADDNFNIKECFHVNPKLETKGKNVRFTLTNFYKQEITLVFDNHDQANFWLQAILA